MKCTSGIALILLISLPFIALMVLLMLPVDIQAATNTTVIEVNISEVAQISVSPTQISWAQVAPGGNGSVQKITIENIGSTTFSSGIYVSVDSFANTTNNPTAGDDATKFMAGTFLVIANSTHLASDEWWFVNQISWNETTYPEPTSPTAGADSWGWYQNKTQKWLWELTASADGTCVNITDTTLKIVGTEDGKDISGATSADPIANTTEWGVWSIGSGPLEYYCMAASSDCKRLMIYKHDINSSLPTCGNRTYLVPGSFAPGIQKFINVKPNIFEGVPSGTVTNSTITFTAA